MCVSVWVCVSVCVLTVRELILEMEGTRRLGQPGRFGTRLGFGMCE